MKDEILDDVTSKVGEVKDNFNIIVENLGEESNKMKEDIKSNRNGWIIGRLKNISTMSKFD